MTNGLYIALLGVDGAGKTTVADQVTERLQRQGRPVIRVNWRSAIDILPPGSARISLEQLWVEAWRLLYLGFTPNDSTTNVGMAPRLFSEFEAAAIDINAPSKAEGVHTSGLIGSALLDLVANIVIAEEVIAPAIERGFIAISDGYGLKSVAKVLELARWASDLSAGQQLFAPLDQLIELIFSAPIVRPDVGILLDLPLSAAYERILGSRPPGPAEDLGLLGQEGEAGFYELQGEFRHKWQRFAERMQWPIVQADRELADVVEDVMGLIQSREM